MNWKLGARGHLINFLEKINMEIQNLKMKKQISNKKSKNTKKWGCRADRSEAEADRPTPIFLFFDFPVYFFDFLLKFI